MMRLLEQNQQHAQQSMRAKETAPKTIANKALSVSPESCTLSGTVASSSGVFKSRENAEGLNNSVSKSSKCDKMQVPREVQDSIKETSLHSSPVTGKALSGSRQAGTLCGSLVNTSGVLASTASAVELNSMSSKCNEILACSDAPDALEETKVHCQASDCGSADSIVEDSEDQPVREKSDLNLSCKIVSIEGSSSKIDVDRIRDTFRKRKQNRITNKKLLEDEDNEMDSESWIERELENGIWLESAKYI